MRRWSVGKPSVLIPNLLKRQFTVTRRNKAWVTDITYIRTWQGWLYLAVVMDLFSRRIVGWSARPTIHRESGYLRRASRFLDLREAGEGLADGIVPAVALAAHAWLQAMAAAEAPPGVAAKLRALIRVNQGPARTSPTDRHQQSVKRKLR